MDSQEVDSPSTREKVDIGQPIRDKEESCKWNHRRSLAWDSAFSTTPGVLDHDELFGSLKLGENEIDVNHKDSIKVLPTEISARPSFAWDNAFFTEPGVLDAEELSLVNDGFITSNNTQPRNCDDWMTTTTTQEGSRFSVSSIEFDLFNHLRRASLCNTSTVKQTGSAQEIQRKLPDGKKRTKWYKLKSSQPLSLIPQPKVYPSSSSSSSSIPKSLTPCQAKPEKKFVATELGRKKVKHRDNDGFEEKSGSESIIRSSYSGYTMKDLTSSSSSSSGLRLPLPKMGFFDSDENGEKENRNPNGSNRSRGRHKSTLETSSPPDNRSVLGQRKKRK